MILIATGSEVGLAMQAADAARASKVRVVSMPSTDVFDRQDADYRESVLPNACRKRVAIEAGVTDFWRKYVGLDGAVIGIDSFGASAPIEELMPHFGFTVEKRGRGGEVAVSVRHGRDPETEPSRLRFLLLPLAARVAQGEGKRDRSSRRTPGIAALHPGYGHVISGGFAQPQRQQPRLQPLRQLRAATPAASAPSPRHRRSRPPANARHTVRSLPPRLPVFAFSHASAFTSRCSTTVKSLPSG